MRYQNEGYHVSKTSTDQLKMSDIASLAGVSVSTVSRALAGSTLVPERKRAEIIKIASANGYVINQQARSLRLKRTQTIGVVIPLGHEASQRISDPFFSEMLGRLADAITERGYTLLLTKLITSDTLWIDKLVASGRTDGLIIIGQSDQHEALNIAAANYLPLVVWGGHLPGQRYCSVGTDNIGGGRVATEHLIARGRKRIVFLGNPDIPEPGQRLQGYREALASAGLGYDPALIASAHLTMETAYDAMRAVIASGVAFDGVFAVSDVIAIAAIQALSAAGRRVPQDVAVVGYDDVALASHANPPLTTIRQDLETGARLLTDLLLQRMAGEETPSATMPTQLIVRLSSSA
jgi:DNA-binding LacI/PurR family transcriptional regulator